MLNVACFIQSCLTDADFVIFSNYCLIGTRPSRCLFCLGWKRFYHFSQGKFTGNQLLLLAQATLMTGSSV